MWASIVRPSPSAVTMLTFAPSHEVAVLTAYPLGAETNDELVHASIATGPTAEEIYTGWGRHSLIGVCNVLLVAERQCLAGAGDDVTTREVRQKVTQGWFGQRRRG
jgi:hypothetical protein